LDIKAMKKPFSRRRLLFAAAGAVPVAGYPFWEARWLRLTEVTVRLPNLPEPFDGLRAAFLSDCHHGKLVPLSFIRRAVALARRAQPDLVLFGGDYITGSGRYTDPCIEALSELRPPLGSFGVLGNHDGWRNPAGTHLAFSRFGITDLTNRGVWLERKGARLRLGGVGDLWTDKQDVDRAVGPAGPGDPVILLSHNPDLAEELNTDLVDLLLCGHTHGGQVCLPVVGAPYVPSRFGNKYARGLVRGPRCLVFTSCGIGTVSLPIRLLCRPEVVLLTFRRGTGVKQQANDKA